MWSLQPFRPNFTCSLIFDRLSSISIYISNMIKRHYKREISFSLIPFLRLTEAEKKHILRCPGERMTSNFQTFVRNRKLSMGVSCSGIEFNPTNLMEILNKVGMEIYYFFSPAHMCTLIHAYSGALRSTHSPHSNDVRTSLNPYRTLTRLNRNLASYHRIIQT
jgi:hypothetical protein